MNSLKTTNPQYHSIIKNIIDEHLGDHNLAYWEMDALVDDLYDNILTFNNSKNRKFHSASEGAD